MFFPELTGKGGGRMPLPESQLKDKRVTSYLLHKALVVRNRLGNGHFWFSKSQSFCVYILIPLRRQEFFVITEVPLWVIPSFSSQWSTAKMYVFMDSALGVKTELVCGTGVACSGEGKCKSLFGRLLLWPWQWHCPHHDPSPKWSSFFTLCLLL